MATTTMDKNENENGHEDDYVREVVLDIWLLLLTRDWNEANSSENLIKNFYP